MSWTVVLLPASVRDAPLPELEASMVPVVPPLEMTSVAWSTQKPYFSSSAGLIA